MTLLITPGMGIGPEVTAKALQADRPELPVVLLGRAEVADAAAEAGLPLERVRAISDVAPGQVGLLVPPSDAEPVEVAAIRMATQACLSGDAAALVTGPIHKARLAAKGFAYTGHTDMLGDLCGAEPVMAFVGGRLRVALVTTHMPLSAVPAAITAERICHVVRTTARALRADLGMQAPRIGVCGLNPHAGESGMLGDTEQRQIAPACEVLVGEGLDVRGPLCAEAAFMDAAAQRLDLVVAMYHDQGLVPLKVVDFGRSVNWTLGLPIVRTSVDHGTADALVGTGQASPASMGAAIALARQIIERRAG